MAKKLLFVSVAFLLSVALVAMAADAITGKWVYDRPMMGRGGPGGGGPGGGGGGGQARPPQQITLDLKADGAKLTGTETSPGFGRGGGEAPPPTVTQISNGKVDGDKVSFEVTRETQMGSMTTKYEGTVAGSEMKLKITRPGFGGGDPMTNEVTAKKQ